MAITPEREALVDFISYSTGSLCLAGTARNPELAGATSVDDLDRPDITLGYLEGTPVAAWAAVRFPRMKLAPLSGVCLCPERSGRWPKAAHRRDLPTLIAGDFNANPDTASICYLTGRQPPGVHGVLYHDAWAVAGEGPGNTWTAENPKASGVIDQIVKQPRRVD